MDSATTSDWGGLFAMAAVFLFFQRLPDKGVATTGMKR